MMASLLFYDQQNHHPSSSYVGMVIHRLETGGSFVRDFFQVFNGLEYYSRKHRHLCYFGQFNKTVPRLEKNPLRIEI